MSQSQHSVLNVNLGERSYDICVGQGLLDDAARFVLPLLKQKRVLVVTDSNVAPLYLERLSTALAKADISVESVVLPAGEATKSLDHFGFLLESLLEKKIERSSTLIALGGGVIGDITGFAASVLLRGINFIQIPTTLLSQVDSSVGGKTGINSKVGKNLIGAFHQPRLVLIDTDTLDTLSKREVLAGYAEVVKYGLIDNRAFFDWLEVNGQGLINGDAELRGHAILTSCAAKAAIVAEDEKETGRRALLNLGHTFGHALEAECGYGETLLHGEAVAIGMVMAFDYCAAAGLCSKDDADLVRNHLQKLGAPVDVKAICQDHWDGALLARHMSKDKKVEGGKITFVLARGIGEAFLSKDVPGERLVEFLDGFLAKSR